MMVVRLSYTPPTPVVRGASSHLDASGGDKHGYSDRKEANAVARRLRSQGRNLHSYRCTNGGFLFR